MHVTDPIIFRPHPRIKNFNDLTGKRFYLLTVLGYAGSDKRWNGRWYCKCDCGVTTIISTNALTSTNPTKSCGCRIGGYKHGHSSRTVQAPEYGCWASMNDRCYNPNRPTYKYYGGKGITVCDRWRGGNGFMNFLADVGPRPSPKHSIDRYPDKSGNYEPSNVRWATPPEQNRNREGNHNLTFRGETLCLTDWATRLQMSVRGLKHRLNNWNDLEKSLTTPVNKSRQHS